MLTLKKIDTDSEFHKLADNWNNLLQRSRARSPFLTWEWMFNWRKLCKNDNELFILCIRDEADKTVGIIPLIMRGERKFGLNFRNIEFMGSDESLPDYLDFIIDRSVEDDVIGLITDYCIEQKDTWDVIKLSGIKEDAVCFKFYDFLSNKGYKTYRKLDGICPYIKLPETWKDYLNTLSKKSRFNVRKKKRVLDTHYKNSFSIIDNEDHLEEVMDQLSELHRKRMTMKGIKNSYSSSDTFWKFQKKIAAEFFRKGWLLLGILQISGKLAACQYAFKFWDKVFHYQTGFDPAYEKYSVGLISVGHMIEASINSGCEEYDFLRGEEDYKLHWAKSNKELFSAYISNNNAKGRIFLRQHITLQWIKQKIKTFGKR